MIRTTLGGDYVNTDQIVRIEFAGTAVSSLHHAADGPVVDTLIEPACLIVYFDGGNETRFFGDEAERFKAELLMLRPDL